MKSAVLGITLAVFAVNASAKDIYVSTGGDDGSSGSSSGDALRTIAAASKLAQPGDTVQLMAGQYQESLIPARSGTPGNPITYKSSGSSHAVISHVPVAIFIQSVSNIVIDGIDVNGGAAPPGANVDEFAMVLNSSQITIKNGSFQYANGWGGIDVAGNYAAGDQPSATWPKSGSTSYVYIQNNVIDYVGSYLANTGDAIQVRFGNISNVLIEGNKMTHGGHDLIRLEGENSVVQDNMLNNNWRDLFGGNSAYRSVEMNGAQNVFQRNFVEHTGVGGGQKLTAPLMAVRGVQNIARNNIFFDSLVMAIDSGCGYSPSTNLTNARIYNNTMYGLNGESWSVWAYTGCQSTGQHAFVNNLVMNDRAKPGTVAGAGGAAFSASDTDILFVVSGGTSSLVDLGSGPTARSIVKGNLFAPARGTSSSVILQSAGGTLALDAVTHTYPQLFASNSQARPVLVSSSPSQPADFALQPNSPGVSQGVHLTNATATGNSTTLPVADTLYFSDGNGLVAGDTIQLEGSTARAQIVSIDRSNNLLRLSSALSFKSGQGVSLTYSGSAPDVGAAMAASGVAPKPPMNVSISH